MYLSSVPLVVGVDLVRVEGGTQMLVHYVSQVLKGSKTPYPNLEIFAFALIIASRKLRHYFQGREIRLITDQPLRKIIHKLDASRRFIKWAVELSRFNLVFLPQTSIKAQALVDFIVECTFPETTPKPIVVQGEMETNAHTPDPNSWELHVDDSSTNERSGDSIILCGPSGFTIQHAITFLFPTTNTQAEYEALLAGLRLAHTLNLKILEIHNDSQIVVKHTNGEYISNDPQLAKYRGLVQTYLQQIPWVEILKINLEDDTWADIISNWSRTLPTWTLQYTLKS